jgi:L-asparaginase II
VNQNAERGAVNTEPNLLENCSGKRAGMLATCVVNGWDIETYTDPNHPLQKLIVAEFETLAREKSNGKINVDALRSVTYC